MAAHFQQWLAAEAIVEKPLRHDMCSFLQGSSDAGHGGPLDNLLSCLDELQAVDLRVWMLEAALQQQNLEDVVVLVERGAPMREAAMACVAELAKKPLAALPAAGYAAAHWAGRGSCKSDLQLANLIAAAHWAGRGSELREDLRPAMAVYPGVNVKTETQTSSEPPHVWSLPPTKECEKACAGTIGSGLLALLMRRGDREDRARIELLVHSGAGMPHMLHDPFGKCVLHKGFKMLYRVSCKAGRDSELLKILEHDTEGLVSCFLSKVFQGARRCFQGVRQEPWEHFENEVRSDLQTCRDAGLLGPLAPSLLTAIQTRLVELDIQLQQHLAVKFVEFPSEGFGDEHFCLISSEELLMQYVEADRWYAQHLAIMLSQCTSANLAKLIATFCVAEPAHKQERRRKYADSPAYTLDKFRDFYGSLADARWHWKYAQLAFHEERFQSFDLHEELADASSSVTELVLQADPPARVEPELTAVILELVLHTEATQVSTVERHLGSASLEEAGRDICSFLQGSSDEGHGGPLYNLLSRLDELQAVDLRVWMLEAALQQQNLEDVVVLVERGVPMREAAIACVAELAKKPLAALPAAGYADLQLANLIAAAHWAGRGSELHEDLRPAMEVYPGVNVKTETQTSSEPPHVWALPPTKECEKACAGAIGSGLLALLMRRGHREDRARIELLVHSGARMPHMLYDAFGRCVLHKGFKMLYRVSCKAGRDSELLKILELDNKGLVSCFLSKVSWGLGTSRESFENEIRSDLQTCRDAGLLGPLAPSLLTAIRTRLVELDIQLQQHGFSNESFWDEHSCLISSEELLMQYVEADRWYAQHLAILLSQCTSANLAKLIATFCVAEPAHKQERRRKYADAPAYTLEEFRDFYGSLANAHWHWKYAQPANHDERFQSVDLHEGLADASSSVTELVLQADPPARVEPEIASELTAVILELVLHTEATQVSAVERQLGSAILEEAGP